MYQKSADSGYADAQFNLGLMYYLGKGVDKDYSEAKCFFQQASAQGHSYALEFLIKVENKEKIIDNDSIFDLKIKVE